MKGIVLIYFLFETDTIKRVKCFRKKVTGRQLPIRQHENITDIG